MSKHFDNKLSKSLSFCLFLLCLPREKAGVKYKSASSLPFLCVVDAHTGVSRRGVVDLLDKVLMQMVVGSQFWMESGGELMPLSDSDDVTIYFG